jgi:Flp pilus assembly protein TadD
LNIILTPNDASIVVDERLRGYPKEAISEYTYAVDANNSKHYDQVADHLEKVIKLAPDWFDAHCDLGAAYEQLHRTGDAEKEYRAALELKPDGFRPMLNVGRMLIEDADKKIQASAPADMIKETLGRARDALRGAVKRDPMSAMAVYMLGAADFRLESYTDAEMELQQALDLDATMYPARITLINVDVAQKKWQDALDNVDTFLLENPSSPYRQQVADTRVSVVRRLQTR